MRMLCIGVVVAFLSSVALSQDLSGTYSATSGGVKYSLTLSQGDDGRLTGTLSSAGGPKLRVEGNVEDGEAGGTCYQGEKIAGYFEAELDEGKLAFMLAEADDDGIPGFENARQFQFSRRDGQQPPTDKPQPAKPSPKPPTQAGAGEKEADEAVTNPNWAFSLTPPTGWRCRQESQSAILGHDEVAGMILVLPHSVRSLEQVRVQMAEGLQEEEGQLTLAGTLKTQGESRVAGNYTGFYEGKKVKGYAVGALLSGGGGAYVIAVATPDKFSAKLTAAADAVARSLKARKGAGSSSSLLQHFAGTWVNSTTNTETRMTFYPDGTFAEGYEASYSGGTSDQYGNPDMSWGTANDKRTSGRWSATGTKEKGVITVRYNAGTEREVQYRVHVENGETYPNEYWFGNDLYGRQR